MMQVTLRECGNGWIVEIDVPWVPWTQRLVANTLNDALGIVRTAYQEAEQHRRQIGRGR